MVDGEVDKKIETTLRSLRSRHINCIFTETSVDAKYKMLDLIPKDAIVGLGDSTTLEQIGIKEELKKRGTKMLDPFDRERVYADIKDYERRHFKQIREWTMKGDVFLTGTNAITQDGRLVNVDGGGNRVAGMVWGHPTTIIVVGRNKVVKDLNEAFHRIRNIIAPNHIRIGLVGLAGRQYQTPCVISGRCNDCRVKDRKCNIFTIIEGKPSQTDMMVIIANEDLGLSWDESWSRQRIAKIIENYKRFAFYNVRGNLL